MNKAIIKNLIGRILKIIDMIRTVPLLEQGKNSFLGHSKYALLAL